MLLCVGQLDEISLNTSGFVGLAKCEYLCNKQHLNVKIVWKDTEGQKLECSSEYNVFYVVMLN